MDLWRAYLLIAVASVVRATLASAVSHVHSEPAPVQRDTGPVNVILDTDMWSDIDDALALAMLHALQDRGEIKLLAVTISTNDPWPASYVSLLDSFYDHPQVLASWARGGLDVEFFRRRFPSVAWPITRYTQRLSERTNADGTWVYPRYLSNSSTAPDATTLLRRTLATQPDGSVVMIQVGYSTNMAHLLRSPPDAISPLDGQQLIARKVRLLSIMSGNFGEATLEGRTIPKGSPEFNLMVDVRSAQALFISWPTPIVARGFEIGASLQYPPESIEHDYAYVHDHPIEETYLTFCEEQKPREHWTCPHAHNTYDLVAVLYAARPDKDYFSVSSRGKIRVLDDGSSRFDEAPEGRDRYLILRDEQKSRTLDAMVMLASQPPAHRASP